MGSPGVDTMAELSKNKADLEKGYRVYIAPSAVTIANSTGPSVRAGYILNATLIKSARTLPIDQVRVCRSFVQLFTSIKHSKREKIGSTASILAQSARLVDFGRICRFPRELAGK